MKLKAIKCLTNRGWQYSIAYKALAKQGHDLITEEQIVEEIEWLKKTLKTNDESEILDNFVRTAENFSRRED